MVYLINLLSAALYFRVITSRLSSLTASDRIPTRYFTCLRVCQRCIILLLTSITSKDRLYKQTRQSEPTSPFRGEATSTPHVRSPWYLVYLHIGRCDLPFVCLCYRIISARWKHWALTEFPMWQLGFLWRQNLVCILQLALIDSQHLLIMI